MVLHVAVLLAAAPFARETHHAGWRMGGVVPTSRGRVHDTWTAGLVGFHDAHSEASFSKAGTGYGMTWWS
jgi:hypothetical protein